MPAMNEKIKTPVTSGSSKMVGSAHPWHKRPRWQKRIQGWACYQLQSWVALLWPEAADKIMYNTLRDQFDEKNENIGE